MSNDEFPQAPGEPTRPLPQGGSFASGPGQPATPPQGYPSAPQGYPPQYPNVPLPPYAGPGQSYPGQVPQQPYPGQQGYAQGVPGQVPPPGYPYQAQGAGAPPPWQAAAAPPYAGPGQPYGQPPAPKKNRVPLILALGVAVLVLGLVVISLFGGRGTTPGATQTPGATGTPIAQAADASAAVRGYLEALAAGDADRALSYASAVPADPSLLTREALANALRDSPLTDIQVAAPSGASGSETISASYSLGDQPVSTTFDVVQIGTQWRLEQVAAPVSLAALFSEDVPSEINGLPIFTQTVHLFPGTYALTSQNPFFKISPARFVVQSPDDRPAVDDVTFALSSMGVGSVRAAAQKKLAACLKKKQLKPSGCGFGVRLTGGYKLRPSTVKWTVTKGAKAMKKLKPTTAYTDPLSIVAPATVRLKCTFRTTNGYSWYGYADIFSVGARMAADGAGKVTFN